MTHCQTCWKFHGRAARWSLRHWWRYHVRKGWAVAWVLAAVGWGWVLTHV